MPDDIETMWSDVYPDEGDEPRIITEEQAMGWCEAGDVEVDDSYAERIWLSGDIDVFGVTAGDVSFNENYQIPKDRPLVPDQGWLNIGCGGDDFEWPTEPGLYDTGGGYEMVSGKIEAQWAARYVGTDPEGRFLYEMTQDFDYRKAVFEGGTYLLDYQAEDEWGYVWVGSGDYFDAVTVTESEGLVVLIDPSMPVGPGNVEPIDAYVNMGFYLYDDETGALVDWIHIEGNFTPDGGGPTVDPDSTCNG